MEVRLFAYVVVLTLCQLMSSCAHKRHLRFIKSMEEKLMNFEARSENSSSYVSSLSEDVSTVKIIVDNVKGELLDLAKELRQRMTDVEKICEKGIGNETIAERRLSLPTDNFDRSSDTVHAIEDINTTTPIPVTATLQPKHRLFIASNYYESAQEFYQMFLRDKSVRNLTCSNLTSKSILSVTYHSFSNSLIIAQGGPDYPIVKCSLDSGQLMPVYYGTTTWGLTTDTRTQRLLLSTHYPRMTISSLDINNGNFDTLTNLSTTPYGLVLDHHRGNIYVTDYSTVMSISSSGQAVKLASGYEVRALAVSDDGQYLYFNDGVTLMRRDLRGEVTLYIALLPYVPWTFAFNTDEERSRKLYVSSFYDGRFGVVDLDNNATYVHMYEITGSLGVAICLLP